MAGHAPLNPPEEIPPEENPPDENPPDENPPDENRLTRDFYIDGGQANLGVIKNQQRS
jgi:hypothetical protein